jgi:hypothetical protein
MVLGICRGGLGLHFYEIRFIKDGFDWQKTAVENLKNFTNFGYPLTLTPLVF